MDPKLFEALFGHAVKEDALLSDAVYEALQSYPFAKRNELLETYEALFRRLIFYYRGVQWADTREYTAAVKGMRAHFNGEAFLIAAVTLFRAMACMDAHLAVSSEVVQGKYRLCIATAEEKTVLPEKLLFYIKKMASISGFFLYINEYTSQGVVFEIPCEEAPLVLHVPDPKLEDFYFFLLGFTDDLVGAYYPQMERIL